MATDRDRCTGAQALPLGRKVPRGSERWYLVRCGEGRELAACAAVARLVPNELLRDAFVPRKERSAKRQGVWREDVAPLSPGHFVAVTVDAPALAEALLALTLRVSLVGQVGRGYAPIAREAQEFLESAMDDGHVVRFSSATVGPDGLRVERGPLVGQEWRIANSDDRHHLPLQLPTEERSPVPWLLQREADRRVLPPAVLLPLCRGACGHGDDGGPQARLSGLYRWVAGGSYRGVPRPACYNPLAAVPVLQPVE